jgi:hypothetical protein
MNRQYSKWLVRSSVVVVLLLAAILVAVGPHAGLAQDPGNPNDQPAPPPGADELEAELNAEAMGPSFFTLPPGAFSSDGYDPDGFNILFASGYFTEAFSGSGCLVAPVNLPAGATVNGLEVWLNDQNSGSIEWFQLDRIYLATGEVKHMAYVVSPAGTTAGITKLTDSTIAYPLITNNAYVYQLTTCVREDIFVYGARVGYSPGAGSAAGEEEVDLPIVVNDN